MHTSICSQFSATATTQETEFFGHTFRVFSVVVGESMRERFLVFFHLLILFVFRETAYPRLEIDEEAEA